MTQPSIEDEVYEAIRTSLPLRVRVLGPERLRRIVAVTLRELPAQGLYAAGDSEHQAQMREALSAQVMSTYLEEAPEERYGFAILAVLLTAAISAIVQQVIQWWWNHPKRMEMVESWQKAQ